METYSQEIAQNRRLRQLLPTRVITGSQALFFDFRESATRGTVAPDRIPQCQVENHDTHQSKNGGDIKVHPENGRRLKDTERNIESTRSLDRKYVLCKIRINFGD